MSLSHKHSNRRKKHTKIQKGRHTQTQRQRQTRKNKQQSGSVSLTIALPPPLDNNIAGKDFFRYVNAKWLDSVHVPPYISSYGISEEVEEIIKLQIQTIVNGCIQQSKKPLTTDENEIKKIKRSIGELAQSALSISKQENSIKSLKKILQSFHCLRDMNDVAMTMGELARYKVKGLVWMYGQYENKRNTEYTYTLGVGSVGLPDISYYKKTAPGKGRTLEQYANMLHKVGELLDIPDLSLILSLESVLANAIRTSFGDDEIEVKGANLASHYPEIPFEHFFEGLQLDGWKQQTFFVDSQSWMRTIQKLFRFLPIETWRLLFSVEVILHFLPYLPSPYNDIHFRFFRHTLRGQTERAPVKQVTLNAINDYMTPFISYLYVKEIVPNDLKHSAKIFVDGLLKAAEKRLENIEWLQPATRRLAVEKVAKMNASVAYPDSFEKHTVPKLTVDNLFENLLKLGEWQTKYEMNRLGQKRSNQKDWEEPVFAVNAYYYSEGNEIIIPSGSLYYPFFDKKLPLGWNYGGLGCVLGHEMTHAFDKDGKDFNPDGFEKKWWTSADNRGYNKRTKALVELFDKQKVLGHPVSGTLTLSENIADLGGLAISLDALTHALDSKGVSNEKKKEVYREFFISYAVSWRVKEKPANILQGLFLDYHAPPPLRVNLVVSQFQEWYDAFDIKTTDPMYISPEQRIRIF